MGELDYIDYLFINEIEARYICNETENPNIDRLKLIKEVQETYGVANVVMTMGSEGSMALCGEESWVIAPVKADKVVNTAGAGDGFMAAAIANLVWGKSLREAMEWAGKYAALSVTIEGTIPAYRPLDEVNAFIGGLG